MEWPASLRLHIFQSGNGKGMNISEPICREAKHCRVCAGNLTDVLDLGLQYVVDFVQKPDEGMLRVPLKLARCQTCSLIQLRHSVNRDRLYRKFWYKSGTNESMRDALLGIVDRAMNVAYVGNGDKVLDIGANDGTLLGWYPGIVTTVGIDPCQEVLEIGMKNQRMDIGITGFFSKEAVQKYGPYKVITAIAMFYDLDDPITFLKDCKDILRDDGVMIIQMNYLPDMLQNLAFDNICHEHLTYFSMTSLKELTDKVGLEIAGAERNDVNGGSFRVFLTHKDSGLYGVATSKQVDLFMGAMNLLHKEQKMKLDTIAPYKEFGLKVIEGCKALQSYLIKEAERGEKIYAYGASTRGTVLSQMLNLPDGVIRGVAERDVSKFGLHMVGTWWKIYPEEFVRERATQMLLLPWHFLDSVMKREVEWMKKDGKLIVPLPEPRVLRGEGERTFLKGNKSVGVGV